MRLPVAGAEDKPVTERPRVRIADFALGAGLAFLAGATDVYGLARLHDMFVSFMSGNTTMLAISVGQADWDRLGQIGGVIAMFIAGAAFGAVLGVVTGRAHRTAVSFAVTLILAVPLIMPNAAIPAFVVAMGALNASMNNVGGVAIGLTYVTGALVKLGQGIGRALCGRAEDMSWIWQLPMWISLLLGGIAATLVRGGLGDVGWPLPLLALVLTLGALLQDREAGRSRRSDP